MTRRLLLTLASLAAGAAGGRAAEPVGWPAYGGGPTQSRYSPLAQIDRTNVARLQVAWTYDSGETGGLQTNPIVVGDTMYVVTPKHRVVALDAATGLPRWTFDSGLGSQGPNRGVTYWRSGADERIFTGQDQYLYALDARTGRAEPGFGRDGRVDLREGLDRPAAQQDVRLTSPGVVFEDLVIVGGRVGEGLPSSPGHIRAYDARTGALRWTFHTIPHPGEFGYDTWPKDAWKESGGANSWPGLAVDTARGLVFVPTGSAAADFYGSNRHGDNLFANTLLALDARTGKRVWHYQAVRHDIWDRDFPAPPNLVTVERAGKAVDAVAQVTKDAHVWLFDRATGEPLFPVEERTVPPSGVDGEKAAGTQRLPKLPAPFARQVLREEDLTRRTPDAHAAVLAQFRTYTSNGQFTPFQVGRETILFPGYDGGAEWGGAAFDPETARLYVNANEMAWTGSLAPSVAGLTTRDLYLRDCASCHQDSMQGAPPQIPSLAGIGSRLADPEIMRAIVKGKGRMAGFPNLTDDDVWALITYIKGGASKALDHDPSAPGLKYRFTGYRKFLDPDGYPAVKPPWGTLNAIDLNTGAFAWSVPLGFYPALAEQGLANTGSENYGGPVVTAGGLVFIGATSFDKRFRAFDKTTGALLWEATLPFSGTGTPATYEVGGRQFVVTPAAGGKDGGPTGGLYVAFALPKP
ncbi:MAG: pyrroloquinoline quinone-dependent dehydrogenase [Vicinamibacteria bacterium]